MKNTSMNLTALSLNLIFFSILSATLGCSQGSSGDEPTDRVMDSGFAYQAWPNDSTSDQSSNEITSKVLVSNLDGKGETENVFLSVLPNSSNKKSSILRVTSGPDFTEIVSYKASRIDLLHDSVPFPFDFNKDGFKELVFVSYDRDQVYAFEFKNQLDKMFLRWTAQLPETLAPDFDRQLRAINFQDEMLVKVGPFGLKEEKNKKVSVIDLRLETNQ